jgi:hypothetical protein
MISLSDGDKEISDLSKILPVNRSHLTNPAVPLHWVHLTLVGADRDFLAQQPIADLSPAQQDAYITDAKYRLVLRIHSLFLSEQDLR